jgi:predicted nucleotidyltransferase
MVSEETLTEITRRLVDGFHPDKIILFGSQARGTADERSDVDILVICPIKGNRLNLIFNMDKSLEGMRLPRDIVILTDKEYKKDSRIPGTIARYASKEGKILYEKPKTRN